MILQVAQENKTFSAYIALEFFNLSVTFQMLQIGGVANKTLFARFANVRIGFLVSNNVHFNRVFICGGIIAVRTPKIAG